MFKNKSSTPIKLAVWILAGLLLLLLIPAGIGVVWAPSCSSCHLQQVEKQADSVHSRNTCISCHALPGTFAQMSFRQRVWYTMAIPLTPGQDATRVTQSDSCMSCHDSGRRNITEGVVENRGLRVNHDECMQGLRCSVCHGSVGHAGTTEWQSRYAMESCMTCHSADLADATTVSCDTCHVGNMTESRNPYSVFAAVHGPNLIYTHGVGDWNTCAPCHSQQMCAACHGEMVPHDQFIIRDHSQVANDPDNQCASCHQNQSFCDTCHGMEIPHPNDFLINHAAETDRLGEDSCYICHLTRDCTTCHNGHVHPGGPRMWFEPRMVTSP